MQAFQDVFISYGRADSKTFAAKLNQRLVELGLTVWFDFEDIPLGVDYQKQIDDGIERADNFLFLISPHSVNSPYCGLEIELALKRNKRIIPLLHVEQISRETWQQRNPIGTDEQWEAYQAAGKHSSVPNLHPAISKINWVYVREGIDDFEASFNGLLTIMERHKAYVHQHTLLLAQALEWERQQKRSPYLLIGEERLKAEEWLQERFKDSQPPCLPTDLHCEFITESRKNADNLMTDVFLAYAEENMASVEKIRNRLRREGLTVWANTTDIQAGAEFQTVIDRGIEEASNVVYLLSPASVVSPWCQHELDYALSLNKRIIPVLVEPVAPEQMPLKVQGLQYIDLTHQQDSDYEQAESQLLRILQQDAVYHADHKVLLAKALKWDRQKRNPTILLRGYNLRHAEAWLKIAHQNRAYAPLPLQETFITESLNQPPGLALDAFISYSRADSGFARKLNDALQAQGKRTWFDQENIAAGTADFQREIHRGIETSDVFLFILSPRSVTSPYCADEVEYAAKLNKRVVTLLYQPIDPSTLHPELAKVQWLDFNQNDSDFSANFTQLLRILDTDVEHLHAHTRLLLRAIEWEEKGSKESLLLRGDDLEQAEQWLTQSGGKVPVPTSLQQMYVGQSRQVETTRQRKLLMGMTTGVVISTVLAIAAGIGWNEANRQRIEADQLMQKAQSKSALMLSSTGQGFDALMSSLQAGTRLRQMGGSLENNPMASLVLNALQ
ncbi:MAG: toll/interleukin-1 receptor domain-containing protein, partial [Leptolyngbyaceae bacterium]|nr:toll/interleukin-1 receptor domain-containing protein [Leptolyngbyaceae bacterium]